MIFPYLRGILPCGDCVITWLLVFLNVAVFVGFGDRSAEKEVLSKTLRDEAFIKTQGQLFAQYILANESGFSKTLSTLSHQAMGGDISSVTVLGGLALRNAGFVEAAEGYPFKGDQVAVGWWRDKMHDIKEIQTQLPSYEFGLRAGHLDGFKLFTYQFIHGGLVHLAINMLFLLIFGSMLEPIIGRLALLVVYLGSGALAAGAFVLLSGASSIPLIGASGAVSGLMSLFCFMFWQKPVRYLFMFMPTKGYMGMIYLPAWITLVMWVLSDMAGYFGTLDEFGGIAYSAHLGGQAAGIAVGATVFFIRYLKKESLIPADKIPPTHPVGTRIV